MVVFMLALIIALVNSASAPKQAGTCTALQLTTKAECEVAIKNMKGEDKMCANAQMKECCTPVGFCAKSTTGMCASAALKKGCSEAKGTDSKSGCQQGDKTCIECKLCSGTMEVAVTSLPETVGYKYILIATLSLVTLAGIVVYARRGKGDEYHVLLSDPEEMEA